MKIKFNPIDEINLGVPEGFFPEVELVYVVFRGHHDLYPVGSMMHTADSQIEDSDVAKNTPFEGYAVAAYYRKEDAEAAIADLNKNLDKNDVHYKYVPTTVSDEYDPYHAFPNVEELVIAYEFKNEMTILHCDPVTQFLDENKIRELHEKDISHFKEIISPDYTRKLEKIPFVYDPDEPTKRALS